MGVVSSDRVGGDGRGGESSDLKSEDGQKPGLGQGQGNELNVNEELSESWDDTNSVSAEFSKVRQFASHLLREMKESRV